MLACFFCLCLSVFTLQSLIHTHTSKKNNMNAFDLLKKQKEDLSAEQLEAQLELEKQKIIKVYDTKTTAFENYKATKKTLKRAANALSVYSAFTVVTAIVILTKMLLGDMSNIFDFIQTSPILFVFVVAISSLVAYFFEKIKHTMYEKGIAENLKQNGKIISRGGNGNFLIGIATIVQIITIIGSFLGAVWVFQDGQGVDKQIKKEVIVNDFDNQIAAKQAEIEQQSIRINEIFAASSYNKKINQSSDGAKTYQNANTLLDDLKRQKGDIEKEKRNALKENGLTLVAYSKEGFKENKMAAYGFGAFQFLVEFFVFLFLLVGCKIGYLIAVEDGHIKKTVKAKAVHLQGTQAKTQTTNNTVMPPEDWKKYRNILQTNLGRYYDKGYTLSRFNAIETAAKKMAEYGYEVKLFDKRFELPFKDKKTLPDGSVAIVDYDGTRISITYNS